MRKALEEHRPRPDLQWELKGCGGSGGGAVGVPQGLIQQAPMSFKFEKGHRMCDQYGSHDNYELERKSTACRD